jgi:hypothetical protein
MTPGTERETELASRRRARPRLPGAQPSRQVDPGARLCSTAAGELPPTHAEAPLPRRNHCAASVKLPTEHDGQAHTSARHSDWGSLQAWATHARKYAGWLAGWRAGWRTDWTSGVAHGPSRSWTSS